MKLLDLLTEESADLKSHRDRFAKRFKNIMTSKTRMKRIEYTEKLIRDLLKKDEIRFLTIELQKSK